MTHEMKLQPGPFAMIRSGRKTVELRLNDEKRRLVQVGDGIVFTQTETGETLHTRVLALHPYPTFAELFAAVDLQACGYAEGETEQALAGMKQYYTQAQQEKWGVLGIEIKVI